MQKSIISELISFTIIVVDTIILSLDSIERNFNELLTLTIIDFVCLIYFFLEVVIRCSFQRKKFFTSLTNLLDVVLFALNISVLIYLKIKNVDIFNDFNNNLFTIYSLIRSFQIARIYRLLISKLIWRGIATMALEMIKILMKLLNFLILLCIFILMMSLIGRDLFINAQINDNLQTKFIEEEIHRMNLTNIFHSIMTNFMLFFDEDWHLIMINHMKAYGFGYFTYFIINTLISTMFLNKVFLALLINKLIESKNMRSLIENTNPFSQGFKKLSLLYSIYSLKIKQLFLRKKPITQQRTNTTTTSQEKSLFCSFKMYIKLFMEQKYKQFEKFMFLVCCFSLILVALNDPFQSNKSTYNQILKFLDIPVLIILIFEIILLVLSNENGLFEGKTIFRLGICIIYVIYFIFDIKILKIFVTFRFIMIIQFYKGLKKAVLALFYSLWEIFQLLVFFFLFILLFAAIGVKLYKGSMYLCQNLDEETMEKVNTSTDCFDNGGDWVNSDFNFDNIFKAIDLLFMVANSSGWLPLMYN